MRNTPGATSATSLRAASCSSRLAMAVTVVDRGLLRIAGSGC
jgi:hypothetical protein